MAGSGKPLPELMQHACILRSFTINCLIFTRGLRLGALIMKGGIPHFSQPQNSRRTGDGRRGSVPTEALKS